MIPHTTKRRLLTLAGLALLQVATVHAQKTPADVRVVTDANRAAIEAAMPAGLLMPAKQPRRILVLSRSMGFYHKATPLGKVFFENVQKAFKGYTFVMSDEPKDYTPENLKQYDALLLNNGTGVHKLLTDVATQKGIIQFVQDGGGIMGIHAASDGGWPEYNEMIGSRFAGHPWTAGGTHAFLNEQPAHGMTKQFGSAFPFKDEIYISKDYFDREKFRVLISMDLSDKETASKPGGKTRRHDMDYAVSHVRAFGEGRVFYTSFGHTDLAYFDNNVLTHYLAGIQYVAGDLEIEDAPIVFYDRLKAHDGPLYVEAKQKLVNMIRHADTPEKKQEVAALCTKLIKDRSATAASRQLAIESLSPFATADSLQVVAGVLAETSIQHVALLFISEHADDKAFSEIAEKTWGKLDDAGKAAVITAMGARGSAFADKLPTLAKQGAVPTRTAAIIALGRCGEKQHADALLKLADAELAAVRDAAVVDIAGRQAAAEAGPLYAHLLTHSRSVPVRQAALLGVVRSVPSKSEELVLRYLSGSDAAMTQTAIMASALVQGGAMTSKLAELAADEANPNAVALVNALARRDGPEVIPALETLLEVPAVRVDAIKMLAVAGGAGQVPTLAGIMAEGDGDSRAAATDALIRLRGDGVDQAIADLIVNGPANARLALLNICDDRRTPILVHAAAQFIASEDSKMALAALKAVALGGSKAEFESLCALVLSDPRNSKVVGALGKLGSRLGDDDAVVTALVSHAKRGAPKAKPAFVKLLSGYPVPAAETYLMSLVSGQTAETELAAVKTLVGWGNATALQALLDACEKGQTEAIRDLAYKGVSEMTANDRTVAPQDRLATLSALLEKAGTDTQIVSVLNALASVPDAGVEALAKAYEDHAGSGVADAAKAAVSGSAELMSKVDWVFSSNFNNSPGQHKLMVDLDPETRWTSKAYMVKSDAMWITVDLGYEQAVTSVVLDAAPSGGDFPRKYELYLSNDPDNFGEPVASGNGAALTDITCDATGRYLKIVQTGKQGPFWSIHELKINGRPREK